MNEREYLPRSVIDSTRSDCYTFLCQLARRLSLSQTVSVFCQSCLENCNPLLVLLYLSSNSYRRVRDLCPSIDSPETRRISWRLRRPCAFFGFASSRGDVSPPLLTNITTIVPPRIRLLNDLEPDRRIFHEMTVDVALNHPE